MVLVCLAGLLAVTHRYWLTALGSYLVKAERPRHVDALVVLAGEFTGHRLTRAAELVREGDARRALVSCADKLYGVRECDAAIAFGVRRGFPLSYFEPLPTESTSTREEAAQILAILRKRGVRSVGVVTSSYHTRRAGSLFRSMAGNIDVHMFAAPDDYFTPDGWWQTREGRKTVLLEWTKTVTGWFSI